MQENVLSNMMRRASPLNLSGMTSTGMIDNVSILRPLLEHNKDDIFDFAHQVGVPYFKDTTPQWSVRGKLRTRLMPLLEEIYGSGYLGALSSLAEQSNQLREMVQHSLFREFHASVRRSPLCVWFDCIKHVEQPLFFWKEVMRDVCHSMGTCMIREKSIKQFMTWLRPSAAVDPSPVDGDRQQQNWSSKSESSKSGSSKSDRSDQPRPKKKQKVDHAQKRARGRNQQYPRNGWPALKKGSTCFLHLGTLHMFTSAFQPTASNDIVAAAVTFAVNGDETRVGCWFVSVTTCDASVSRADAASCLTMDQVLSGIFSYSIRLYDGQLLSLSQVKPAHPAGGLDPKFRKMIPFVMAKGKPGSSSQVVSVSFRFSAVPSKEGRKK